MSNVVLHVEAVEQTANALQLRFWKENPNEAMTRTVAPAEIDDLIKAAEQQYYTTALADLKGIGKRLYDWLDGGERWLTNEIKEAAHSPLLVLAIAMPYRLSHLPWEVLFNGANFLLYGLNPPVLPVRWSKARTEPHPVRNRPLQLLFMAASPKDTSPVLDFEGEEAAIMAATARRHLDLTVEESGCLKELATLMQDYGANYFDVLHLTCHGDHAKDVLPVLLLESETGKQQKVSPIELAKALPRQRPPLVFLSGCRTGQNAGHGVVRSYAEQLLANGFRAVIGWGQPVRDSDAVLAAQQLYESLAAGEELPLALLRAHAALREAKAKDWHLLRLFCAGGPFAALVTPVKTPGRMRPLHQPAENEFLDPLTRTVKVATRSAFVGRRELLQQSLRRLKKEDAPHLGVLLQGQGGRGKSSIAARLCDRLRRDFQRVVVIGRLDELTLINAWALELPEAARPALRDSNTPLRERIEAALKAMLNTANEADKLPPLFVLDDFEQNQPRGVDGDLALAPHAASVLGPLLEAMSHSGIGRILMTCRYALPSPFARYLHAVDVPPLNANEQRKQTLRLDQKAPRQDEDARLLARAQKAADGNPRLFEWLHQVLEQPGLEVARLLAEMEAKEEKFREDILARHLIASLPEQSRTLLSRMLLLQLPAPYEAMTALMPEMVDAQLRQALRHAADISLVDVTEENGQPHYRVPRQLAGGEPGLLAEPQGAERRELAGHALNVLCSCWWDNEEATDEPHALELIRLAAEARRGKELASVAAPVTSAWLSQHRYRETESLLSAIIEIAARHHTLLLNLARAKVTLGHGDMAGELLREASANCPATEEKNLGDILFHLSDWLIQNGEPDEALDILQNRLLPILERLGDVRSRAVTLGKIADVLADRGQLDEALRIRREEELPVYERLGDVRARAVTLGKIADVLAARGQLDEALRIRREEQLPVFERLGDVRARAVTLGQIADVLAARGQLDEALRTLQEELLPVFERLGDVQSLIAGRVNIALMLLKRQRKEDVPEIVEHFMWSYQNAKERGYLEAAQIERIMRQVGLLPKNDPPQTP